LEYLAFLRSQINFWPQDDAAHSIFAQVEGRVSRRDLESVQLEVEELCAELIDPLDITVQKSLPEGSVHDADGESEEDAAT